MKSIPAGDWKIVMAHGYYYASGSRMGGWKWYDNQETIGAMAPLFEEYGVDLVFSGHIHQMELLHSSGVTYVISGAFGGHPDPEREYVSPASLWYQSGGCGFVTVSIDGEAASIEFRDPDYSTLAGFTLARGGQGPVPG